MSLTETFMLVALGFALALLFVLLFGRGFWAIATNFGARRKVKNIPFQMLELQSDRDRLRAEHAMMSRKLELRLEEIKARMTAQMAEVSRSRNRVQTLVEQLEASEATVANRDNEIAGLKAQIETFTTDLEQATTTLNTITSDNAQKNLEITKLKQSMSQLSESVREKSKVNADASAKLRSRVSALAAAEETEGADGRIQQRISELTSITAKINEAQSNADAIGTPVETTNLNSDLEFKFEDAEREADSLTRELKSIEDALAKKRSSPYPAPTPVKSSAKANIISLAQRIRAMQGDKN